VFSVDTEAAMKPGSRTNMVESHNSTEIRRGSISHPSDTPHGGHPPPPPMRAAASNKTRLVPHVMMLFAFFPVISVSDFCCSHIALSIDGW